MAMMSPPMGLHDQMMIPPTPLMSNGFVPQIPQYRRAIPGSPFDFPSPLVSHVSE